MAQCGIGRKPLGFLWGLDDPVATTNVLDGLRELRPTADVVELPGVGHYPQVEDPEAFRPRRAAPAGCVALSRYARKVVIAEVSSGEAEVATFW